ncbi:MAG: metallophosphoesterase [Candidatus Bilamarchaeaceae archaeon]
MKLIDKIDFSEKVYLIPLGDIHLGSKGIDYEKLQGYIDWIANEPHAYCFLMGDVFDVATITSPTNPFKSEMNLNDALKYLSELVKPIREKIIGAITGNHETRLERFAGFNPLQAFCDTQGITYAGYSAIIRFRIGSKNRKTPKEMVSPKIEYVFFAHHTTGGGATIGGKLNRVQKLTQVFVGADAYLGGHNHSKAMGEEQVAYLSKNGRGEAKIDFKKIFYIDTGSFLIYDNSYAEEKMLPPSHTGAPRIRMDGFKKDLHISY